jgi:hypothetical protein
MYERAIQRRSQAVAIALLVLGSGSAAAASFSSSAMCEVGRGDTPGSDKCAVIDQSSDFGLPAGQVLSTSFTSAASEKFTRQYSASVRSGPGDLGVKVDGLLEASRPATELFYVGGTTTAYATYSDTVLVSSATLPAGTPVTVELSQVVTFSLGRTLTANPTSTAHGQTTIALQFNATGVTSAAIDKCWGDFFANCTPTLIDGSEQTFEYRVSVDSYVGGSIAISGGLAAGTFLSISNFFYNNPGVAEASSSVNSLHSAHTYFSTSTPGVSLVAESGHQYAPVPEPERIVLRAAAPITPSPPSSRTMRSGSGTGAYWWPLSATRLTPGVDVLK